MMPVPQSAPVRLGFEPGLVLKADVVAEKKHALACRQRAVRLRGGVLAGNGQKTQIKRILAAHGLFPRTHRRQFAAGGRFLLCLYALESGLEGAHSYGFVVCPNQQLEVAFRRALQTADVEARI